MTKIAVNGASGRMGSRILALAEASKEFEIAGKFDMNAEKLSGDALKKKGKGALIDFSSPAGTLSALEAAGAAGWGLVVGTTGLDEKVRKALSEAGQEIPIVFSSNMSVGVNFVLELLELAARKLPKGFTLRMSETHHIHKKDAPSGTALLLSETLQKALKAPQKIDVRSLREGEVVGDHSVFLESATETIEIKHHAKTRDIFAQGALIAAQFVSKKNKGFYSMRDVLA